MQEKGYELIAAYTTFKQLYAKGNYRSSYQILAEFISYIIYKDSLYSFSLDTMVNKLYEYFGFHLPHAVVATSLSKLTYISYDGTKRLYRINKDSININSDFQSIKTDSDEDSDSLLKELVAFVKNELPGQYFSEKELIESFISYLLDEDDTSRFSQPISKFILMNENNPQVCEQLKAIREGSILYAGLSYNIRDLGSLQKDLTLYLDTEIIFNLMGYNGVLYESLAKDFFELVNDANKGKKRISLKYFKDVKEEIDSFFYNAERIVSGKEPAFNTIAMQTILNGCKDPTDVVEKQADFYKKLNFHYGVLEDDNEHYYSEDKFEDNLEGIKLENIDTTDSEVQKEIKTISNINKLRHGESFTDYTSSRFLIVTETSLLINISKAISDSLFGLDSGKCAYALRLNTITNILWYKLNRGFGNHSFPSNINATLKARTVLSKLINGNVEKTYHEIQTLHKKGEIDDDTVTARLYALKQKATKPEELSVETINDDLNFDDSYISRYEGELERKEYQINEQNTIISQMEKEAQYKDKVHGEEIQKYLDNEKQQEKELSELKNKVLELEAINNQSIRKKRIALFILLVIGAVALLCGILLGLHHLCNFFEFQYSNVLSIIIGVLGLAGMIIGFWKNVYSKIVPPKE